MSFLKIALPLTFAGLLAGLTISFLITPRWVSTAVMEVRGGFDEADVNLTNEEIAAAIEDPQNSLFEEERAREPEKAIAIARSAIQISVDKPTGQGFALVRIRTTYRTRRGANLLAFGVITALRNKRSSGDRQRALQERVEQLKIRLAALQAHAPVPPAPPPLAMGLDILDMPTVPGRPEYPPRLAIMLTGGVLGLFLAVPISRRNRYH